MLDAGVVEESTSAWSSPMVIVKKKDGSNRICVDYRKLNSRTKFDAYPMPRIDDLLDAIGQSPYLTTIDLMRGYWQVPMSKDDREKMAFSSPYNLKSCRLDCVEPLRRFNVSWTMCYVERRNMQVFIWTI